MTRDEVVSLRQRLLDGQFQPVAIYNLDKRPSELNWQNTVGMPAL